jgi:hypothetical protein
MYDTGFLTKILLRLSRSSIYRIIELTGGWEGHIIRTEVYFNVLGGATVVLAIFTLNFTLEVRASHVEASVYERLISHTPGCYCSLRQRWR